MDYDPYYIFIHLLVYVPMVHNFFCCTNSDLFESFSIAINNNLSPIWLFSTLRGDGFPRISMNYLAVNKFFFFTFPTL